ncbi:hypothetical protein MMC30_006429 [Trapelia coarctata]|nr:hypothetical protein [Trapelia coarctata]
MDPLTQSTSPGMTSYIPSITLPGQIFAQPAASILLPIVLGTSVGFSIAPKGTQKKYMALKQPPYSPPPWLFGPAWTVLYGLMGFAAYRAWTTGMASFNPETRALAKVCIVPWPSCTGIIKMTAANLEPSVQQGATLYTIQLGLNLIWMPLFFGLKRPVEAMVDITVLTGVTGYLTYIWGHVDPVAGWALAPYLGWLSFASYLNAGTGHLNDWDIKDKERDMPPGGKPASSNYVNEAPHDKAL